MRGKLTRQTKILSFISHPIFKRKKLPADDFKDNHSRGCQSCQQGRWLCIFLTYRCDAHCAFCPAPFKQEDKIISAFGDDPAIILRFLKQRPFTGISFSGGECFLVFDRLLQWLKYFKKNLPDLYYWAYTNGLSANEAKLQQLADSGLHEIRFNIAAAGYDAPQVLQNIQLATRLFDHVAIEIPSIPHDYQKMIALLPFFDSIHVHYLNLHEYILMPEDPHTKTATANTFIMNKKMKMTYDVRSLDNTEKIKQYCQEQQLSIKVNNCSLVKKENQMLHRRLMLGSIFKQDHEHLSEEGFLQTYFVHKNRLTNSEIRQNLNHHSHFVHPDVFQENLSENHRTVAKLTFLPPMSHDGQRVLLQMELMNQYENEA